MAGTSTVGLFDRVGWRAKNRPQSGLAHVLGAGAGVFAVVAVEDLVEKITSDNATLPGVLLNVALILVALAVALAPVGPARAAAVVALVVATPTLWFFVFYGNHQAGTGWFRAVYLLSAAMYLVFYMLLWTKGRAIFLGLTLLFVAAWIQFEIHRQVEGPKQAATIVIVPITAGLHIHEIQPAAVLRIAPADFISASSNYQAAAALGLGVIFLAVGSVLIRKRYLGAAVPFLVVGAIEAFAGAVDLGVNEGSATLLGLLIAAVGLVLGFAGTGNTRRGSVWIGVIGITFGLLVAISGWTTDVLGRAGYAGLMAIALLGAAWLLMRPLHEAPDGGEPNA
jgi:hypothetical protein